jgi:hypothetical protein
VVDDVHLLLGAVHDVEIALCLVGRERHRPGGAAVDRLGLDEIVGALDVDVPDVVVLDVDVPDVVVPRKIWRLPAKIAVSGTPLKRACPRPNR